MAAKVQDKGVSHTRKSSTGRPVPAGVSPLQLFLVGHGIGGPHSAAGTSGPPAVASIALLKLSLTPAAAARSRSHRRAPTPRERPRSHRVRLLSCPRPHRLPRP